MSDHLERLIGQARQSMWDPEYVEHSRDQVHGIRRDTYDKLQWDYTLDRLAALKGQVDNLADDFETSPPAYEDLFNLLMQGDPRPTADETVDPKYVPQAHMMRAMGESIEFEILRSQTRYDEYNTALAMLTMREKMRKAFENLQDTMDAMAAAQEAFDKAYQDALDALANGEGAEGAAQALQDAMDGMQDASQDAEAAGDQASGLMRSAGKEASQEIERQEESAEAYGLGRGQLKRMPFEERRKLAEQLSTPKLEEVTDLVGQFRQTANTEARRTIVPAVDETVNFTLGNDLERLAESEMINLAIPELSDLFVLRYLRHELVIEETQAVDHADRGPFVLICDESGSMGFQLSSHTREAWSKALCLAILDIARRQKRDFIYIGYGGVGQVWEKVFPKGQGSVEDVVDFVTHFWAGGTEYQVPLRRGMAHVAEYAARGHERPDIMHITDGDFYVPDAFKDWWREARDQLDVKCYGLQVGGKPTSDMRKISDRCMQIDRLTGDASAMREIFRGI